MHRPNRLLTLVKSARLQHATLGLFTMLVLAYAAVALIGFGLFAIAALALAWFMSGTLDRQQRTIADQRRREEALEEQAALLQSTLENMGEGLSVFDRHGRLIAWNSRFAEM